MTKRTVYKINDEKVKKLLAEITVKGVSGHPEAVKHAKQIFFAVKGNEKRPVTAEEASKLINKGYTT